MASKSLSINNLRRERQERDERFAALKSLTVRRPFAMRGRRFAAGDRFKIPSDLDTGKIAQLIDQRYLEGTPLGKLEAARRFTFLGRDFAPGDEFSAKGLKPEKVTQLLEHRFIQPAVPATP